MITYTTRVESVEARRTGEGYDTDCEIMAWCSGHLAHPDILEGTNYLFSVFTGHGDTWVAVGDWVVRHADGSFRVCDDATFNSRYVEDPTPATFDELVAKMSAAGWVRVSSGSHGALWEDGAGQRQVVVPAGLSPDSWEWPGVLARIR